MTHFLPYDDDESLPFQPPHNQSIVHFHDLGMSHTDQCRPLRDGLIQSTWNSLGPGPALPIIHNDSYPSHDDSCLSSTGCSQAVNVSFPPLTNNQSQQQLPAEQPGSLNLNQQPGYGFMATDEYHAMDGCCSSSCSAGGNACEAMCEEACQEPCEETCTIDEFCGE